MKNKELQLLLQGIYSCGNLKGVKFAYAMAKNRKLIERELELLHEVLKPTEKFLEYDKKRIAFCDKYAEKGTDGKPKIEVKGFSIADGVKKEEGEYIFADENKKKFDESVNTLRNEYKQEIDDRDKQVKEFNELLKKESEIKPYMVRYEDVPMDITSETVGIIINLIKEPECTQEAIPQCQPK